MAQLTAADKRTRKKLVEAERQAFRQFCQQQRLPEPVHEFVFHESRKWPFDWAWPKYRVALEIQGGIHTSGRHTRGVGYAGDMEKWNAAQLLGWRVLLVEPDHSRTMATAAQLRLLLANALVFTTPGECDEARR